MLNMDWLKNGANVYKSVTTEPGKPQQRRKQETKRDRWLTNSQSGGASPVVRVEVVWILNFIGVRSQKIVARRIRIVI